MSTGSAESLSPLADSTTGAGCRADQVDINSASTVALTRIVHVGAVIAERIVAARPFQTVEDLLRVSGIGQVRLQDIAAQGMACVG